jgi:hypothetical protein
MDLELGSGGTLIRQATEEDILGNLHREGFVGLLLSTTPDTYVKCVRVKPDRWWRLGPRYCLEYQDCAADKHYRAVGQVSHGLVVSTLLKYLRKDSSWIACFRWQHVDVVQVDKKQACSRPAGLTRMG